ncbi:MAG TPA: endolytic transglycosylase MltG [Streptomyces sp.]|nr:endolytic transglycosylase MltG [Streptomyces sp.]
MTEYGRGPGSEPWYPDDPLYGDPGWNGAQQGDWDPYGGQQQQQYHPQHQPQHPSQQQPHASHQEPHHQDPHLSPYGGQGWETQGGGQPYGMAPDPYGQQPADPYGQYHGQPGHQDLYPDPPGQQGHFGHQGHFEHPHQGHQGQYPDPSGHQGDHGHHGHHQGHEGQYPGHHGAQDAHPPQPGPHGHQPQQPPTAQGRRRGEPEPGGPDSGPDEETGWDPGPDQGEHAFFADDHDDRDHGEDDDRDDRPARVRDRRGRAKRKNAGACLVVAVVLVGGVGTVGYFVHDFYQSRFAAPPDFSGQGNGEIQVEIPEGSSLAQMGAILEKAGVVKSQGAFIEASNANTKALTIQPGVYMLRKEMSAKAAIEMMLDPASQNALIIAEGKRASEIYALIDEKLGLEEGATAKAAKEADLGLPEWAGKDPEGFLFPAKYTVGDKTRPEDLLRQMVDRAEKEFAKVDLVGQAGELGLETPLDVLTVASLVQAEGKYKHDFVKVSRVVYNRLKPGNTETNGYLQFDSTYNYAKNQYTLDVPSPSAMARFDHPYNTYAKKGLPPGPINSPGAEALHAAVEPAEGGWYYFVSVTEENTVFTDTYKEHQKYVEEFNAEQKKNKEKQ